MAFAHLHVHSQYSLLDGTMDPTEIASAVSKLGMEAVALTDTVNMYGAVAFYKACKKSGVKSILGAELHFDPDGIDSPKGESFQIVALVENDAGYASLCQLVTKAIFDGNRFKPRIGPETLQEFHEGLIFLTGGRKGLFGKPAERASTELAVERLQQLQGILGPDQLYVELVDMGFDDDEARNAMARELAEAHGLLTVVTNAVHYRSPEDAPVHETLNAIAMGTSMSNPQRVLASTDQAYLKTEEEIRALFPIDAEAIDRTAELAERCTYHFDFDTYHFPATTPPELAENGDHLDTEANWAYFYEAFPPPRDYGLPDPADAIPPKPNSPGAGTLKGYFKWYSDEGLKLRLTRVPNEDDIHKVYWDRLQVEIDIINNMGFPAYMLIVAEFINWSKDNLIPVGPGRGSAAGSLVAYAMRITDIDPIRYDLLFERFLNPERVSMPDIDVDFCQDRREEAIEHVREKYGAPLVSQIITYGKLKAKAAVRDVARALNLSFPEADRIAKLIPDELGIKIKDALSQVEQLQRLRDGDPKVRRVLDLALGVEGMCRQTGVHAAGVVIADRPLVAYAPLYRDSPEGGPVVQYDMKSAEGIGLIKFDFLGLKTLDQIRDAAVSIERNHHLKLDMSAIPIDDDDTYALLQRGDALGVFQLESSGMRDLLTRLRPNVIDDLVALVALYRPGPLSSGMTDDFVLRKHDPSRIAYPLPILKPILQSTYGTIVYQEQVMQIAQVMSGYSLGEADMLRRAMGKKDMAEMDRQKARFVSGAVENKIDETVASDIFDLLAKFAAYGFNKSHSAAYGVVSYQTAYLKAHYRAEYMAALMTIESGNTDKVLACLDDCKAAGLEILPVDINESQAEFWVPPYNPKEGEKGAIRYGMVALKGVGEGAVEHILEVRKKLGGSFRTPFEFFRHIDFRKVNKRVVESLIKAGGFDRFGVPRASLATSIDAAVSAGQRAQADAEAGQVGLFAALAPAARPTDFHFSEEIVWPFIQRLQYEREVLGLYLTGHPMQAYIKDLERHATAVVADLPKVNTYDRVRVMGVPGEVKAMKSKRGDKMAFVQVEDHTGTVECVFFPEPWARSSRTIQSGEPLLITGKLEIKSDGPKIIARTAERLSDVRVRSTREVRFKLSVEDLAGKSLAEFEKLLQGQRGECDAVLVLRSGDVEIELELPEHPVDPGMAMEQSVEVLFRRDNAVELR